MPEIRIAIAGVGNCASALLQGTAHYRKTGPESLAGTMQADIGGYAPSDLVPVAAFDIDLRKVGKPLEQAILARPNCVKSLCEDIGTTGVVVEMAPVLDGVAGHMEDYPDDQAFRPADAAPVDVATRLTETAVEVLICFLPVGSDGAVEYFAEACLQAGVAMVNCVPSFIASDPVWAEKFRLAGLPIIGDDIKSQFGATIVHRQLVRLLEDRGLKLDRTYQLNTGGNTDFLNMLERDRLTSKKKSKTEAVQSQLEQKLDPENIHVGPSDYVPWQGDNKVCFIRLEGRGFAEAPFELELRLSVQDSPNSAGVVIDAVRCAQLARKMGLAGPVEAPSAFYMKSPPVQMRDSVALERTLQFQRGAITSRKDSA